MEAEAKADARPEAPPGPRAERAVVRHPPRIDPGAVVVPARRRQAVEVVQAPPRIDPRAMVGRPEAVAGVERRDPDRRVAVRAGRRPHRRRPPPDRPEIAGRGEADRDRDELRRLDDRHRLGLRGRRRRSDGQTADRLAGYGLRGHGLARDGLARDGRLGGRDIRRLAQPVGGNQLDVRQVAAQLVGEQPALPVGERIVRIGAEDLGEHVDDPVGQLLVEPVLRPIDLGDLPGLGPERQVAGPLIGPLGVYQADRRRFDGLFGDRHGQGLRWGAGVGRRAFRRRGHRGRRDGRRPVSGFAIVNYDRLAVGAAQRLLGGLTAAASRCCSAVLIPDATGHQQDRPRRGPQRYSRGGHGKPPRACVQA